MSAISIDDRRKAIRTLVHEPLVYHDNIQWLGRCLLALHPERYCIVAMGKPFHIRLSSLSLELLTEVPDRDFLRCLDNIKNDMYEDRRKCLTIIDVLSSLQSEEEENIRKRIALEEDERSKYRRY